MKRRRLAFGIFLIAVTMINPGCKHEKHQVSDEYQQHTKYKFLK